MIILDSTVQANKLVQINRFKLSWQFFQLKSTLLTDVKTDVGMIFSY